MLIRHNQQVVTNAHGDFAYPTPRTRPAQASPWRRNIEYPPVDPIALAKAVLL
jgi:hypothetical protein